MAAAMQEGSGDACPLRGRVFIYTPVNTMSGHVSQCIDMCAGGGFYSPEEGASSPWSVQTPARISPFCAHEPTVAAVVARTPNGGYLRELPAPYPGSVLAQGQRVGVRVRCRETSAAQVFLYARPGGDRARCVPVRTANQGHPRSLTGKANTR
jgi:hypothetical protein